MVAIDKKIPFCGSLKWNNDISIGMRRSTNIGESWKAIKTIVDFPAGQLASNPSMIVLRESFFFNLLDLDNYQQDTFVSISLEWLTRG